MPVPSAITDLSQTAGSNFPAGSESPTTTDDYLRQYASFIALLRDGKGHSAEVDLASAATCDIGGQDSLFVRITGTTTITSFDTNYNGPRFIRFAAALTLTHNASTLILPGGANITTSAGDTCLVVPISGGWVVTQYQRASGLAVSRSGCTGLSGANNSGTPTTQLDLSALEVCLRDSAGSPVIVRNTGTKTCNFSTAGPAANGRDQAGAFSANSWVYVYFIWNGSTLATLASTTAPASYTGSTLPTGYTHWAFATAVRWNASSNIPTCYVRGSWVTIGRTNVLSSGNSLTDTAVSLSSVVPPNALNVKVWMILANGSAGAGQYSAFMSMTSGGITVMTVSIGVNSASGFARDTDISIVPNLSQQVFYKVDSANVGANIDVTGYQVPNGDS